MATELGISLAQAGHEVHFISSRLPARLQQSSLSDVSFHEVNTYSYALFQHSPYTLALAAKLADVADTFELDILHVHYAIPHAISAHLAREMLGGKIKVVTTLHGTDITLVGSDPSLYRITRFAINQADVITAVSEWLRQETIRQFNPIWPVDVIPNFIDGELFHPGLTNEWSGRHYCAEDRVNLIHVSNFRPVKRAPEAVEVFAEVLKQQPAHLLMVGDGPDLPRAVSKAKELGVSDHVAFLGNREDVAYLLAACDILLLPSESESFGLSALEAMACGCAVIASDIGGLPELVRDGIDGYLCPLGDIQLMAGKAVELIAAPEQLKQMQQRARQRAVDDFATRVAVERYQQAYLQALGKRAGGANAGS